MLQLPPVTPMCDEDKLLLLFFFLPGMFCTVLLSHTFEAEVFCAIFVLDVHALTVNFAMH